jgi:DNA modification methylase
LRYVKNSKTYNFYADEVRVPYAESTKDRAKYGGAGFDETGKANYLKADGKIPDTVWTIPHLKGKERIGYPTQKPESLIERIIKATTKPGEIVADFFLGGGSTIVTAEKLGRRWIGCDVSKVAISVTKERLSKVYNTDVGIKRLYDKPKYDFKVYEYCFFDNKANNHDDKKVNQI